MADHGSFLHRHLPPRFLIEYVKNVQVAKEIEMINQYGINMGQLLSIPCVILGIALVVYALMKPRHHWKFPNKFPEEAKK